MVKAFLINKFRGDKTLLDSGIEMLINKTGIPVLGVLDYIKDLRLPEEDALPKDYYKRLRNSKETIDIGIVALPHMSNMTDFDPLLYSNLTHVRLIKDMEDFEECDCIIIPGSKNTISDLAYLRNKSFDTEIKKLAENGKRIVGICGGFQMLGRKISDPKRIESDLKEIIGLGLLDIETEMAETKSTVQTKAYHKKYETEVTGYEIHHGKTISNEESLLMGKDEVLDAFKGNVWGTYIHGIFDNRVFLENFLKELKKSSNQAIFSEIDIPDFDKEMDRVVEQIKRDINLNKLLDIVGI